LYKDGEIFYPTGNEIGGGKLKLSEDGNSVSKLWDNQVDDEKVSAILVDGYIYESNRINSRFNWRCVDWETGKEVFTSRDLAPGRVLYADGLLYIYTLRGELALVKPDPEKLNVISRTKVTHGSGLYLSQPVIHQGILYVRHGNAMIAYSVNSGKNKS
jgi:outer membrane protein assembly factor BamB